MVYHCITWYIKAIALQNAIHLESSSFIWILSHDFCEFKTKEHIKFQILFKKQSKEISWNIHLKKTLLKEEGGDNIKVK